MRIGKILRFGRTRSNLSLDIVNLFNSNDNLAYGTLLNATWPAPTPVLLPRIFRVNCRHRFLRGYGLQAPGSGAEADLSGLGETRARLALAGSRKSEAESPTPEPGVAAARMAQTCRGASLDVLRHRPRRAAGCAPAAVARAGKGRVRRGTGRLLAGGRRHVRQGRPCAEGRARRDERRAGAVGRRRVARGGGVCRRHHARPAPREAAQMRATLGAAYLERGRVADALPHLDAAASLRRAAPCRCCAGSPTRARISPRRRPRRFAARWRSTRGDAPRPCCSSTPPGAPGRRRSASWP